MGIFRRSTLSASAGSGTGAVGLSGTAIDSAAVGVSRSVAVSIPTISRARDLLASLVASLPIRRFGTQWTGENLTEIPLPPEAWQLAPDSSSTRSHVMAWTFDDLFFHGRAIWYVTARYANGYPARFQWLPWSEISVDAPLWAGNSPIGGLNSVSFQGTQLPLRDVILFSSPVQGLLSNGWRSIATAQRLDAAAARYAVSEVPAGWLKQTGGEPLSEDELADLAAGWQDARRTNSIAALNEWVEWHESTMDPSRLQLVEARQYQALELARLCNVPPFLVGAPAGTGMTYLNAQDASSQAIRYGALPYIEAIEQTLSSEAVTPRGQVIRLDRSAWEIAGSADRSADTASKGSSRTPEETPR